VAVYCSRKTVVLVVFAGCATVFLALGANRVAVKLLSSNSSSGKLLDFWYLR
jgi:hypothetical protein